MRPPIGPYVRGSVSVVPWDPRVVDVAAEVAGLIRDRRPDLRVEHIGSTAVPGLPGKGVVDLAIATEPADVPRVAGMLTELGFGPQPGPDPWPPTRPMLVGSVERDGITFRLHVHVQPGTEELTRDVAFRDALLADPVLTRDYAALKSEIVEGGLTEGHQYTYQKQAWISEVHRRLGVLRPPISPPATIGILGGGQLGRMLALAARAMGYRIAVLDPDPLCPAAAFADRVVVATYDDVGAALRLADWSDVVTYELEHVAAEVIDAIDAVKPVHPGRVPLGVTQDRLAERAFVERVGLEVAPWRAVGTARELRAAATDLGMPLRLKAARGGYDGRSQLRLVRAADLDGALERLGRPAGQGQLVERELAFEAEVSIVVARGNDGWSATFPLARNVHDDGILIESVAPAPVPPDVAEQAAAMAERLAVAMGLVGTLTAELFLMPDGRLVVNELAPRVHNSGHWTIEGAATSQFEQHIRAICGLGLGATRALAPSAMVNLLGRGPLREARLDAPSLRAALAEPDVHLHLYDKRRVFERRKMGHVTVLGATVDEALDGARAAAERLCWTGETTEGGT
ncbi:MAG TPA: 5-(carboxyamino)imidazole ribonucleotide synthase [Candidatus Saccharimonadales bacterium]|nr:5-(carboxyamino)imidazole ribonucleotide synthase [Candidatus Saccharimonadales bacterium]